MLNKMGNGGMRSARKMGGIISGIGDWLKPAEKGKPSPSSIVMG
jgi:hypothetical protein